MNMAAGFFVQPALADTCPEVRFCQTSFLPTFTQVKVPFGIPVVCTALGHRPPTFVAADAGVEATVKISAATLRIVTAMRREFQITVAPDLFVIAGLMRRGQK